MKNFISIYANETIAKAIKLIQLNQNGIVVIVNKDKKVLGTVTDGDIRRKLMLGKKTTGLKVSSIMNSSPILGNKKLSKNQRIDLMIKNNIYQLPIVDNKKKLISVETIKEILKSKKKEQIPVLIMAGGYGKRLQELTEKTPKPLLKIADKAVIELLINNLINYGFRKFFISIHYKAEKIIKFLGDGSSRNINIEYLYEDVPLGTAGAIKNLPKYIQGNFLMINSDIVTNLNFLKLTEYHKKLNLGATICVRKHTQEFPYGKITKDAKGFFKKIVEKPKIKFFINSGVYIFNRKIIDKYVTSGYFDCDNLLEKLKKDKKNIGVYNFKESWIDIGSKEDLLSARKNPFVDD